MPTFLRLGGLAIEALTLGLVFKANTVAELTGEFDYHSLAVLFICCVAGCIVTFYARQVEE